MREHKPLSYTTIAISKPDVFGTNKTRNRTCYEEKGEIRCSRRVTNHELISSFPVHRNDEIVTSTIGQLFNTQNMDKIMIIFNFTNPSDMTFAVKQCALTRRYQ